MARLFSFGLMLSALAALATATIAAPAPKTSTAADWPQYRGPNRDNLSPDKGLLKEWPADGPKLLWTGAGAGEGFSSVSVVGDKVFTMGDKGASSLVFALSRDKGDNVWSHEVGKAGGGGGYKGTRSTPTIDGDLLYAIGQFGDLVCLETATGKEKWRKNFAKDFAGSGGGWSFTESPLIDGDRLVCTPGGAKASMVALDKKTGAEIWRAPLNLKAGYSSIVISNAAGVKQYVQLTAAGTIGVSAKDGKLLWHYKAFDNNTANIPTPVVLGNQVFTTAGYGRGGALLTLSADGAGVKFKEEYLSRDLQNKHGGVVVVGDYVYGYTDSGGNPYCAEWKTGKVVWTRKGKNAPKGKGAGKGSGSVSVTSADGMLYLHYQSGWVALVPAGPDGYVEKGGFQASKARGNMWAHPVVIGGRLYIREQDNVYCYDVQGK